jgi:hypothetical protein
LRKRERERERKKEITGDRQRVWSYKNIKKITLALWNRIRLFPCANLGTAIDNTLKKKDRCGWYCLSLPLLPKKKKKRKT